MHNKQVRTNKNICLYCFGDLNPARICTSCQKKADDSPAPAHHLPQRTMLNNRYLICKALGEGGFGITYLAWDLAQGIKSAVKEYFPSGYVNRTPKGNNVIINEKKNQAASNRGLRRFIDEAKILAKLKNLPGIVSVRDFFSANGTAYIVMEFLDGISLKKYMQRKGGKITMDETLTILRPIMESLIHVHELNLIHRDISPDNILITRYNEVKLIDFGAAKQSNLDGKSLSIVLKQGFAPEEQYRTHGEQGGWTDIYALAVSIYYCTTGKLPPESIQRMYKDTIIKPSEHGASITPLQESALMKALAVYAKNRYRTMEEMIKGLYGQRAKLPNTIANTSNRTNLQEPTISKPHSNSIGALGGNSLHSQTARSHANSGMSVPERISQTSRQNTQNTIPKTLDRHNITPKTLDERRKEIAENRAKRLAELNKRFDN